jgi:hypothetical protein
LGKSKLLLPEREPVALIAGNGAAVLDVDHGVVIVDKFPVASPSKPPFKRRS